MHARRCDQKNPARSLDEFLYHGGAKVDVLLLLTLEVLKDNGIDPVADCGRHRAGGERADNHAQRHELVAVHQLKRGEKQQHRQ